MNRKANIERLKARTEPWDVVVIGGGATGVGCALDAATRGLDVLCSHMAATDGLEGIIPKGNVMASLGLAFHAALELFPVFDFPWT